MRHRCGTGVNRHRGESRSLWLVRRNPGHDASRGMGFFPAGSGIDRHRGWSVTRAEKLGGQNVGENSSHILEKESIISKKQVLARVIGAKNPSRLLTIRVSSRFHAATL